MLRLILCAIALVLLGSCASATVIVVPESAYPVVQLAATELQYYVQKSTGIDLPVIAENELRGESADRIYLGATRAARAAGIDASTLPRDAYHIKSDGAAVFLVGGDGDGDPLNKKLDTPVGTLFAVYDVLDNDLGVRWLWPGKSGEYVPHHSQFRVSKRDEIVKPRFRFCGLRTNRTDEILWLRRMRMHGADGVKFGHAFGDWGSRYGSQHPEWFEMDSEGVRHPGWSMCVSNRDLQKQIVDNWWADQQPQTGSRTTVNVCENDRNGNCCCLNCLALDGAEAPRPRPLYYKDSHNVARRYAQFAMDVLKLARERDPNAEVTCYAYLNYLFSPAPMKLDSGLIVGFVADVFYPRTAEDHQWVLRQWQGWAKSGASLFLRPNYLLNGYCMPENWARQIGDEFQFCERRGMIGTDFDSLNGQWSTMGPVLYVVGRLHSKPREPIDNILREYYAGFGAASKQVREYWEYWERYTRQHTDVLQNGTSHWTTYPKSAYKRFPIECFEPARKLLDAAEREAVSDPDAAAKVAFLRTGLEHARLCVQTSVTIAQAQSDDEKRKALEPLQQFRRGITEPMAVNIDHEFFSCVDRERASGWPE
ncbi:MAG: DUF4838 domain-containing protein [Armatimonadota bacterium]|jgi:hypothetical protein